MVTCWGSQRGSLLSFQLLLYPVSRSSACTNEVAASHCHHNNGNFSTDLTVSSQPSPQAPRQEEKTSLRGHEAFCLQKSNGLIYFLYAYHAEEPDYKPCTTSRLLKQIPSQVFLAHNEEIFDSTLILLHSLCKHTVVKGPVCSNPSQIDKTGCFFRTRLFIQYINHLRQGFLIQTLSVECDPKIVSIARSRSLSLGFALFVYLGWDKGGQGVTSDKSELCL